MPNTIVLCDISIDTTEVRFLSLSIEDKIKILDDTLKRLQNSLNKSYSYTVNQSVRAIFTAPEYYFAYSNTIGIKRQYKESEAREIEQAIAKLSNKYKKILIIPGTVAWEKKMFPPSENNNNASMYEGFSTFSTYQEIDATEKLSKENYINSKVARGIPSKNTGTLNNYEKDYLSYYKKSRDGSLLKAREVIMTSDVVNNIGGGYKLILVAPQHVFNLNQFSGNIIILKRNDWKINGYFIKNGVFEQKDLSKLHLPYLNFPNKQGEWLTMDRSMDKNKILIDNIANFCGLIDIPPNDARYKLRAMLQDKKLDELLLSRNTVYFYLDGIRRYKYHKRSDYQEVIDRNSNVYIPGIKPPIVKIAGITFGIEICFDHGCKVLTKFINENKMDYTINPELGIFKQLVDIHLILSASVPNYEDNVCSKQNGYLIHSSSGFFRKYQHDKQLISVKNFSLSNDQVNASVNVMELHI